jgi:putative FmdB family regulatory protein
MPRYAYQCRSCGVEFETSSNMAARKEPKPCPACSTSAPRKVPDDVSGTFNQAAQGPGPQNTGVSSFDLHVDRVVGQHAKQGWIVEEQRRAEKRRVLQNNPSAKSEDLSMNPDGTYRVRAQEEKAVHERAVAINTMAGKALKAPQ